jgi:hypothetical protein
MFRGFVTSFQAGSREASRAGRLRARPGCESLEGRVFLNGAWSGGSIPDVNPQPLPPHAPPVSVAAVIHLGATGFQGGDTPVACKK